MQRELTQSSSVFLLAQDGLSAIPIGPQRGPSSATAPYGVVFANSKRANSFWIAERYGSTIERLDYQGRHLETLSLAPEILRGTSQMQESGPPPRISYIREDRAGLLWLWVQRTNPEYKRPVGDLTLSDLDTKSGPKISATLWHLIVIDVQARRLVATTRQNNNPAYPVGDELMIRASTPRLQTTLRIERVEMVPPSRE